FSLPYNQYDPVIQFPDGLVGIDVHSESVGNMDKNLPQARDFITNLQKSDQRLTQELQRELARSEQEREHDEQRRQPELEQAARGYKRDKGRHQHELERAKLERERRRQRELDQAERKREQALLLGKDQIHEYLENICR
ncbi:hypothetical protein QAD02_018154, partial [Eretmocerus hayati]